IPEYRRTVARGMPSILVVVLAVVCALLAGIVANPQLEGSDRVLAAADYGEEQMDVLMEVLMEDRKISTETSEEAQDTPPGPQAEKIVEGGAAKGTDHPPFETE
ncbi:unnamed protein product, partial [Ectocarpus sp. 8 AP-2014]